MHWSSVGERGKNGVALVGAGKREEKTGGGGRPGRRKRGKQTDRLGRVKEAKDTASLARGECPSSAAMAEKALLRLLQL